jgi:hypothetical protein
VRKCLSKIRRNLRVFHFSGRKCIATWGSRTKRAANTPKRKKNMESWYVKGDGIMGNMIDFKSFYSFGLKKREIFLFIMHFGVFVRI